MSFLERSVEVVGREQALAQRRVAGQLAFRNLPLLWLNSVLLFGAFAAIALAASVSFDRLTPALGVTLGIVITMYFNDHVELRRNWTLLATEGKFRRIDPLV